jgi:hypothetical protein
MGTDTAFIQMSNVDPFIDRPKKKHWEKRFSICEYLPELLFQVSDFLLPLQQMCIYFVCVALQKECDT